MGAIKEKMFEIAELIQRMLDEGVQDSEVDEYLEAQLSPEDYEFYHQNKDVIFQHFLGYMGESLTMPRLVESEYEENWEDEEDDEDYNDDDLADYEWSVGSALTAQLEDQGISIDSDNLGDALRDQMDFILQCMKDGWNPLDCAVELINDEEFMSHIRDEDDDDYEDFEDYDDMDESLMMPKLDEGCNCGKKRIIPNIVRRPTPSTKTASRPIIRRPMPKRIHERFIAKSDPIKDMGIGVDFKREAKKFMDETRGNMNTIAEIYFNNRSNEGPAYLLHKFFKLVQNGKKPQDAFYMAAEDENYYGNESWVVSTRKMIADSIFKNHGIKVNPDDPRLTESIIMKPIFEDDMKDVHHSALVLSKIFQAAGKNLKPSGLGRGDNREQNVQLMDEKTGVTYSFTVNEMGEVFYKTHKIGNILDEKSLKDGLYRYMRLGSQEQYESKK